MDELGGDDVVDVRHDAAPAADDEPQIRTVPSSDAKTFTIIY